MQIETSIFNRKYLFITWLTLIVFSVINKMTAEVQKGEKKSHFSTVGDVETLLRGIVQ